MNKYYLRQDGQVLLVGLMIVALITTIVGAGALRATTSTRTTKQQEEASKASNVAKGIQEALINNVNVAPTTFVGINPGVITTANQITTATSFVTPNTVAKDSQYVFYMANYDSATNLLTNPLYTGAGRDQLDIYYDNANTCPVIEVTEIDINYSIVKKLHTPTCGLTNTIVSSSQQIDSTTGGDVVGVGGTTTFGKMISYVSSPNTILVIVRPYYASTKIGFVGTTTLKPQGTEITANTRTIDGAQVTEKSYIAYPQIPLALFATSF